jgi:hypothetical protein
LNPNSGVEANGPDENFVPYSSPAVKLDDGSKTTYVMDSRKVIAALEEFSPTPSLHLDSDILPKVEEQILNITNPLRAIWMPKIPRNILNPESAEYFERTRAKRVGMSLDEFEKHGLEGGEKAWELVGASLEKLVTILKGSGGPYFMGSTGTELHHSSCFPLDTKSRTVSYADFVLVATMQMFKKADQGVFDRVVAYDPVLKDLFEASGKWLERDDR